MTRFAPAPFTLGLLRPVIVIPDYLAVDSARERLGFVLAHETAHVVRRDQWVALLQTLARILFWWNPMLQVLNRELSQAREEICDDFVLLTGGNGRKFAATLLDVAERTSVWGLPAGTALLDNNGSALERRIRRLLQPRQVPVTRMGPQSRIAAVLFGVLLLALGLVPRVHSDEPYAQGEPTVQLPTILSAPDGDSSRAQPSPAGSPRNGVPGPRNDQPKPNSSESAEDHAGKQARLSGDWLLTLPAGFQHRVTLTALGRNRYLFAPARLNMAGVYELRGAELQLVEPNDPRLTEFKWQALNSQVLLLAAEPPATRTGARYSGASLTRLAADHRRGEGKQLTRP